MDCGYYHSSTNHLLGRANLNQKAITPLVVRPWYKYSYPKDLVRTTLCSVVEKRHCSIMEGRVLLLAAVVLLGCIWVC